MKRDNKVLSLLGNLDIALAGLTLAVLIILTVLGVAWRYVFAQPFTWLEEVQLACMVWIVFAAGGAAFRTGNHVAIEMIVDLFPKKVQKVIEWLISGLSVCSESGLYPDVPAQRARHPHAGYSLCVDLWHRTCIFCSHDHQLFLFHH